MQLLVAIVGSQSRTSGSYLSVSSLASSSLLNGLWCCHLSPNLWWLLENLFVHSTNIIECQLMSETVLGIENVRCTRSVSSSLLHQGNGYAVLG